MVISENVIVVLFIIRVLVDDLDYGGNGDVVFIFMGGDGVFVINEILGELCLCYIVNI